MPELQHIPPMRHGPHFAPAADLVEAERREGAKQREARDEREEHRQQIIARGELPEQEGASRIDRRQEDHMARHGAEILPAEADRLLEVIRADILNHETLRRARRGAGDRRLQISGGFCDGGHIVPSRCEGRTPAGEWKPANASFHTPEDSPNKAETWRRGRAPPRHGSIRPPWPSRRRRRRPQAPPWRWRRASCGPLPRRPWRGRR